MKSSKKLQISSHLLLLYINNNQDRKWRMSVLVFSSALEIRTTDLMKDLVLDDVDLPNLEYRSGAGLKNFFRMATISFETLLNMIGPKFCKCDTRMRS